jgi:heme exporter protein D
VFYVALFVSVGVVSLAVLGALTLRLWRQVRQFGREVAAAGERLARASDALQQASGPPRGR